MITGDMLIGDVAQQYPHAVPIMLSYGLHCVGCKASPHETVSQGAIGHGMPEGVVKKMIQEINDNIPEEKPAPDLKEGDVVVKLTEKAASKAKELMNQENHEGGLRIGVVPGGCSGYSYQLEFEDRERPDDVTYDQFGLKIYVNKNQAEHIQGMELDYIDTLNQQGFKFNNPNAAHKCGCGSSFGV
ncbi:MAG: iron-sulfur cluster assembly accessory protein [Candidatus Nanoarchaeia archaeon]